MTKEQFQAVKSAALTGNLKTKFTPEILFNCCFQNAKKNAQAEALTQIERAIRLRRDFDSVENGE